MNKLQHICFIIDGNRRWAKERGEESFLGHQAGFDRVIDITKASLKRGIPYITFWGLSTENLKERSSQELAFLFKLIATIPREIAKLKKEGVRFLVMGDIKKLPKLCQIALNKTVQETKKNTNMTVALAVNYGGRDEIMRAMKQLLKDKTLPQKLTEDVLSSYLDTRDIPDPDIIVRTGGKIRLSGWMPWQAVYAELYFVKKYWPDFNEKELDKAIAYFKKVGRNFGK